MADRISIRDLAKIAGVSRTTVSLALRDSHEISPAVREKIQELARQYDYRSHPAVNLLMQQVRTGRRIQDEETIAYITSGSDDQEHAMGPLEIVAAARQEAHRLGFKIEVFWAGYMAANSEKLARTLYNRGIRGVLWGPMPYPHPPITFPWHKFVPMSCTPSAGVPNLPTVSIHHPKGMALTLEELHKRGARRIGVLYQAVDDSRHDYGWQIGIDLYRARGGKAKVTLKIVEMNVSQNFILKWVKANRPDALVLTESTYRQTSSLEGKLARAMLDVPKSEVGHIGGLYQDMARIGRHAVRFLSLRLANGNVGLPEYPYSVIVQSSFVDGESLNPLRERRVGK